MHVVTCLTSCDVADSELEGVKDEKAHKVITTKSLFLGQYVSFPTLAHKRDPSIFPFNLHVCPNSKKDWKPDNGSLTNGNLLEGYLDRSLSKIRQS